MCCSSCGVILTIEYQIIIDPDAATATATTPAVPIVSSSSMHFSAVVSTNRTTAATGTATTAVAISSRRSMYCCNAFCFCSCCSQSHQSYYLLERAIWLALRVCFLAALATRKLTENSSQRDCSHWQLRVCHRDIADPATR